MYRVGVDGLSGRGGFDVILGGAMGDTASGHSGKDVVIDSSEESVLRGDLTAAGITFGTAGTWEFQAKCAGNDNLQPAYQR